MYFKTLIYFIVGLQKDPLVDNIEFLLDKLEEGVFCDCFTGMQQEVSLLNEQAHKVNCLGKVKLSEFIFELKESK